MTDRDKRVKMLIESGLTQAEVAEKIGVSKFTVIKIIEKTGAKRPIKGDKSKYVARQGIPLGGFGKEIETLSDLEVEALIRLCSKGEKTIAAALLDFWLEYTDI